jgi:hypothetical protein
VACFALATACSSAFAQDRETWRCDVPNGHFDRLAPPIWDQTTSISGRINFHKADLGPDWGSTARIGFTDSKLQDGDCHCNGILVKAFEDNPGGVTFFMLVDGETIAFTQNRTINTPITFKISVDQQGLMTVQIGKEYLETKTAVLPHIERDTLFMSCSGADVSFLNVNPK